MKKPFRKYKQTDLELRNRAPVVHGFFLDDKADFTAMFTAFEDPFADDFLAAINDISVADNDDWFMDEVSEAVELLGREMEDARALVTKFFAFIRIAFEGDRSVLKAFGSGDVKKAVQSYSKMSNLLEKIRRQSELPENKPVLLAAGLSQADIDMLGTLSGRIDEEFEKLSDAKSARVRHTKIRIEKYNKVFGFMQKLAAASKQVYREDYAKRIKYNLNFGRKKYTRKKEEEGESGN